MKKLHRLIENKHYTNGSQPSNIKIIKWFTNEKDAEKLLKEMTLKNKDNNIYYNINWSWISDLESIFSTKSAKEVIELYLDDKNHEFWEYSKH